MLARLRSFTRALLGRRDFEAGLDTELDFHLEARAADLARSGLAAEEARRRARLELGARETYREQCRQARGLRPVDELSADLRYAWRGLKGSPGFAAVAVSTLGLAMAANLACFTFFDAFVFRPLPIAAADRYVDLSLVDERGEFGDRFTAEEVEGLRSALTPAFEGLYGATFFQLPIFEPERRLVHGQAVSAGYLSLFAGKLAFGRGLLASEDAGQDTPAVLSDVGWRRLFHGDPAVLGRKLRLANTWFTVVGVMGPDFRGAEPITPELWIPIGAHRQLAGHRESPRYNLSGTLRPGAGRASAGELATAALASLGTRAGQLAGTAATGASEKLHVKVEPRRSWLEAGGRRGLAPLGAMLFAAFLLVLLIACANLASLHLARASARHREIATRLSLGSSRLRLVRQLLTESLVLSGLGAALGVALAFAGTGELQRRVFSLVTAAGLSVTPIALHWHVVAYAAALALTAGVAFGLLPALVATSPDLAAAARRDAPALGGGALGGRVRKQRLTGALIAAQVAGSLVLLTLAGLMIRTVREASRLDAGFDPARIVEVGFPEPTPAVAARLRQEPEIASLTSVMHIPLAGSMPRQAMRVDDASHNLRFNFVDDRYFETMRIGLEAGRGFWPEEAATRSPVVVVSAATARLLWPGTSALGRALEVTAEPGGDVIDPGRYEVVGVAADVVSGFFFQGHDTSVVYFPAAVGSPHVANLLVRPRTDTATLTQVLDGACQEIDPAVLCKPATLARWAEFQRLPFVAASTIAGALGLLALGLTAIGLHGLVAFAVVQRLRELGVRIALGASSAKVLSTVLSRALGSVLIGVAVGLPACWLLSRAAGRLFRVLAGFDALGLVGAPLLLLVIALVAALIPARRAMGADPVVSLRAD